MRKLSLIILLYLATCTTWASASIETSETLQNGQFYSHSEGYSCKLENGERIYSYKDSIYFNGNEVCQTGDLCSQKVNCKSTTNITDLHVFEDQLQVIAFGTTFVYGKDLSESQGLPDQLEERTMASLVPPSESYASSQLTLIYIMWAIGLAMTFYMYAPEN